MGSKNTIAQYRYAGQGGCLSSFNGVTAETFAVSMGTEGGTSTSFKDFVINPHTTLSQDNDYYCKVSIPQDVNYDMAFNIKLIKEDSGAGSDTSNYQFLKYVTIPRGGSGENIYDVVLYEDPIDNQIKAEIPIVSAEIPLNLEMGKLYYISSQDRYVVSDLTGSPKVVEKFNDLSVSASWITENTSNFMTIEIGFSPVGNFNLILFEMIRGAEDYNIQRIDEDGNYEYGRKVDISQVTCKVCAVTNLLGGDKTATRIGITSHPNLMTMINGEEIFVGPAGIYEQDVMPIKRLGVIAEGPEDAFVLDYEYEISDNNS